MTKEADIWELERRCWVEGRAFYKEIITEESAYAFPSPMGIFKGTAFVDQMGETGACETVEFENQIIRDLGDIVVVLYVGKGKTSDGSLRKSHCSTVWEKRDGGWKLAVHHQTPVND